MRLSVTCHVFQSTLSMRRATNHSSRNMDGYMISIHALHEESDRKPPAQPLGEGISIHALHEESDVMSVV